MLNKIIAWFRSFVSPEENGEDSKSYIQIATPDLATKVKFGNEESMRCEIKRIDGKIEFKFERLEELR